MEKVNEGWMQARTQVFEKGGYQGTPRENYIQFKWPHPFQRVLSFGKCKNTKQIKNSIFNSAWTFSHQKFTYIIYMYI